MNRAHAVDAGSAPAASVIICYNHRASPVLSYVSQFACPTIEASFPDLDQWSVHGILRIPFNCIFGSLCHSIASGAESSHVP